MGVLFVFIVLIYVAVRILKEQSGMGDFWTFRKFAYKILRPSPGRRQKNDGASLLQLTPSVLR